MIAMDFYPFRMPAADFASEPPTVTVCAHARPVSAVHQRRANVIRNYKILNDLM